MKFICENCKAKYQIGDDKIAGRSVRMKCRRCGHLIQLSASVTESGSSAVEGHEVEAAAVETASSAAMSVSALLGGASAQDALAQLREEPEDDPTRAMTREQRAALGVKEPVPATVPARTPAPAPAARPAFASAAPAGGAAVPRAVPPPGGPSPGTARPGAGPAAPAARGVTPAPAAVATAARPLGATPPPGAARPLGAPAAGAVRPGGALGARPASQFPPPAAGVAAAFQKTLAEGTAPADAQKAAAAASGAHVPHGEDWYVGVAGVPLGPVRLAVIREKALAGAVHAESLVWREGFDEWQPLKMFPELLQIVEEAQTARGGTRRPSAIPPRAATPLPAVSAPKPMGVTAPSPFGGAKTPAPAPFQPKATAVGVGIPAVTLPGAQGKAPLGSPAAPLGAKPGLGRSAIAPPAAPAAEAPARPAYPGSISNEHSPHSSTAVSPMGAPTPSPGGLDLFPGVTAPAPAPTPLPAIAAAAALAAPTPSPGAAHRPSSPPLAPTPSPGPAHRPSSPPLAAAPMALFGAPAPAPTPLPAARASADPIAAGVAASAAVDVMRDPFAAPPAATPAPTNGRSSLASLDTSPRAESPSAAPPPSEAPLAIAGLSPRRGMHPIVYAFIAMAAAFGAVGAYMIFARPPQQVIVYQPMPGQTTPTPGTAPAGADTGTAPQQPADVPSGNPGSDQPRTQVGGSSTGGKAPDPKASGSASSGAPLDTSGFNNNVVPGPTATSTSTGPDPSLGVLSAGEIQGVVAANQARVRKRCWQPALDSAGAGASPNARVRGHIVIGSSGSVDSATASGAEKDFPGLSSCIAGQMKGWKFNPSGGSTPVDVPFVFAGQ